MGVRAQVRVPGLAEGRMDPAAVRVRMPGSVEGRMDPAAVLELAVGRMDPAVGRAPVQVPERGSVRVQESVQELGPEPGWVPVQAQGWWSRR